MNCSLKPFSHVHWYCIPADSCTQNETRCTCTVPLRNKRTKTCAKYANAHTRIRVCPCAYTRMAIRVYAYTKYTRMLISIYELAYCCFLCNTVVECCFNGLVILGLYGLTKSLRAKYGSTSHSFIKFFI